MENAKKFYSYGDMPPWGEGPIQGKIHNGPQYIEDNFPKTDKFLTCSVGRWSGDDTTAAKEEVHNKDEPAAPEAIVKINPPVLEVSKNKMLRIKDAIKKDITMGGAALQGDSIDEKTLYVAMGAVCVALFVFLAVLLKSRKKVASKSS
jgi:hypothetical protein